MTKRRIHNDRNITESKKYGCVCTCCHRNDLPWYNCVIFVKHNYNLSIPAVANALSKWYWEIRHKEFICKSCHKELKDGKYSKNVQNCVNSDMFGSNVNDDQNYQHNVQEKRMKTLSYLISQQIIHPREPLWHITVCVHVAIKLIYQDHNASYSKHQSTIMTILWLWKHYLTDTQILHLRNTSVRHVIKIYCKKSC